MSDIGVYVFTYQTGFFSGSYCLADIVDALKEHLNLDRITGSKGIVFVCHSMGGIVVRRYLVSRAAELIERNVQVALFLLASPSLGADYANWLKPLAKILGHSQGDALHFARSNAWLADLDRDFLNLKEQGRLSIVGKELIEDRFIDFGWFWRKVFGWFWRKQVVEPFSGARYFGDPYKVPASDHFSIAKIETENAIQHRQLRHFIAQWRRIKTGSATFRETVEQNDINAIEPSNGSPPTSAHKKEAGELNELNAVVLSSETSLSVIDAAVTPAPYTNPEVTMGALTTSHLVDRFWDLDASDRREIVLELGLISDREVDLPERRRYDTALDRAIERNLLDRLEQLVEERE